jgi:DNA helicase-4
MGLNQAIDELRQNLEEINKQHKLKRLRKVLRFLLIGFLIGRDSDKRISELNIKNRLILKSLINHFEDLEHIERIKDFADSYTQLTNIEERMRAFKEELADAQNLVLNLEERLEKYREMIVTYTQRAIEQREHAIDKKVEGIVNSGTYLIYSDKQRCIDTIKSFEEDLNYCDQSDVLDNEYIDESRKKLEKSRQTVLDYNKNFIQKRKEDYGSLWSKGLDYLDDEQQTAIITDDKHNLVVAAAGSGKTEVLITRIVYLVKRKPDTIKQHRILAIAYQNKDVEQIEKRLSKHGITSVNVRTFHGLGIDILQRTGKMRSILGKNERPRLVKEIYQNKLKSESDFYHAFLSYVKSLHETKVEEDIVDKVSTLAMKKTLPYTSIDDTHVQSRAEKEILDFLLTSKLNGTPIHVKYEPQIENLGKPDFFLPKYDLFIEHWGLNKNGEVPEWFSQSTVEYKENMKRKKKWFAKNNKLLVETFAYEYDENHPENFIQLLKDRIIEKLQSRYSDDFHFSTMTYRELIEVVCESDRDWISEDHVSKDIFNFIKNAKTYNLEPERILQKLENGKWSRKQRTFGRLAIEVYEGYQEKLRELQKIDFEDMINNAIDELKKDKKLCKDIYDHILVDEYQDITQQIHKLVKQLLHQNPNCKLFCVGDDWQSVMGFAGSNLEFFVNFEKHFKNPAITKISTNYRSVGTIVDAGASLISNNRSCQMHKRTVSKRSEGALIKILRSPHRINYRRNYHQQIATDCINRVAKYLKKGYAKKDILILSRFMHIHTHQGLRHHYIIENIFEEADNRGIKISKYAKTTRNVRLLTVHKAKGLEAKVVFILNVIKDTYGFPCEIEDSSILEPARENYPSQDQKEEERRLFYVAMTRAMEDLNIYTWEPAMSEFLEEIADYTIEERLSY